MKLLTCGSLQEVPSEIMLGFNGIWGSYYWSILNPNNDVPSIAEKYNKTEIWSTFLYGNKHQSPDPASGTSTIEEWVKKLIKNYQFVTHWNLINEFINDRDNYNPYPSYQYEDIKRYLLTAKENNPDIKLLISDFRPHQLDRWRKIKSICEQLLTENIPLDGVGIQVHCKTSNAHSGIPGVPFILDALPTVIKMFDGIIPVHVVEASMWRRYDEPQSKVVKLWDELITICAALNIESFTPWWLVEPWDNGVFDNGKAQPMPSFEQFRGAGIYNTNWERMLYLPFSNTGMN